MSAETSGDVCHIKDEDVLRKMWTETEDFGKKKEIRSHMYKLREERLRNFYSASDLGTEIQRGEETRLDTSLKDINRPNHADSLFDHSFLSMKTKEIRDSESPSKDMHQFRPSSGKSNNRGWEITSNNEVSDDGKTHTITKVATTSGTEKIDKGVANYSAKCEQKASVYEDGNENNFTKTSNAASRSILEQEAKGGDDNSSYHSRSTNSSSTSKTVTQHRSGSDMKPLPNTDDSSVIRRETFTTDVPADLKRNPNYIDGNTIVTRETKTLPDGTKVTTTRYETKGISSKLEQQKFHTEQKAESIHNEKHTYQTAKQESHDVKNVTTQAIKDVPRTTHTSKNITETITCHDQDAHSTRQQNHDDVHVTKIIHEKEYMPREFININKETSIRDNSKITSTSRNTDDSKTITSVKTNKVVQEGYAPSSEDNTTIKTTTVINQKDGTTKNQDQYSPYNEQPQYTPNNDITTKTTTIKNIDDGRTVSTIKVSSSKTVQEDESHSVTKIPTTSTKTTISDDTDKSASTTKTTKIVYENGSSPYEKQLPEECYEKPHRKPGDYTPAQSTPGEFTPVPSTPGTETQVNSKIHQQIHPQDVISKLASKPTTDNKQIIQTTVVNESTETVKPSTEKVTSISTHSTYQTDYTSKRISVDISPTHDAFARSLRASPDRDQKRGSTRSLKSSTSSLRTSVSPDKKYPDGRDSISPDRKHTISRSSPDSTTKRIVYQDINTNTITRKHKSDTHTSQTPKRQSKSPSPSKPTSNAEHYKKYDIVTDLDTEETIITESKKHIDTSQRPDTLDFNKKSPNRQTPADSRPSPTNKKPSSPSKMPSEKPFKRRDTYEDRCRQILGISEQTTDVKKTTERTNSRKIIDFQKSPDGKTSDVHPNRKSPEKRVPLTSGNNEKQIKSDQYHFTSTTTIADSRPKDRKPESRDDTTDGRDSKHPKHSRPRTTSPTTRYRTHQETDDYYITKKINEQNIAISTSSEKRDDQSIHENTDDYKSTRNIPRHTDYDKPHHHKQTPSDDKKHPSTNFRPKECSEKDIITAQTTIVTEVTEYTDEKDRDKKSPTKSLKIPERFVDKAVKQPHHLTEKIPNEKTTRDSEGTNTQCVTQTHTITTNKKSPEKINKIPKPKEQKPSHRQTSPGIEGTNQHYRRSQETILITDETNHRMSKQPGYTEEQEPVHEHYITDKRTEIKTTSVETEQFDKHSSNRKSPNKGLKSPDNNHPTMQDKKHEKQKPSYESNRKSPENRSIGTDKVTVPLTEYSDEYCLTNKEKFKNSKKSTDITDDYYEKMKITEQQDLARQPTKKTKNQNDTKQINKHSSADVTNQTIEDRVKLTNKRVTNQEAPYDTSSEESTDKSDTEEQSLHKSKFDNDGSINTNDVYYTTIRDKFVTDEDSVSDQRPSGTRRRSDNTEETDVCYVTEERTDKQINYTSKPEIQQVDNKEYKFSKQTSDKKIITKPYVSEVPIPKGYKPNDTHNISYVNTEETDRKITKSKTDQTSKTINQRIEDYESTIRSPKKEYSTEYREHHTVKKDLKPQDIIETKHKSSIDDTENYVIEDVTDHRTTTKSTQQVFNKRPTKKPDYEPKNFNEDYCTITKTISQKDTSIKVDKLPKIPQKQPSVERKPKVTTVKHSAGIDNETTDIKTVETIQKHSVPSASKPGSRKPIRETPEQPEDNENTSICKTTYSFKPKNRISQETDNERYVTSKAVNYQTTTVTSTSTPKTRTKVFETKAKSRSPDKYYEVIVDECYNITEDGRKSNKKSASPKPQHSTTSPDRVYRMKQELNEHSTTKISKHVDTHSKPPKYKPTEKSPDRLKKTPELIKPNKDSSKINEFHQTKASLNNREKHSKKLSRTEYEDEYCSPTDKPRIPDTKELKPVHETFTATKTYLTASKDTVHRLPNKKTPDRFGPKKTSTEVHHVTESKVKEDNLCTSDEDTLVVDDSSREHSMSPDRFRKAPKSDQDFYTLNIKVYKTDSNIPQGHTTEVNSNVRASNKVHKHVRPYNMEPNKDQRKPINTVYRTEEKHYINKSVKPVGRASTPEKHTLSKHTQKVVGTTRRITATSKPKLEQTRHVVTTTIQMVPKSKQDKRKPTPKAPGKTTKPNSQPVNQKKPTVSREVPECDNIETDENNFHDQDRYFDVPTDALRKPDKVITTKSIIINNDFENEQKVVVNLQRSKSSRETTPDRTYAYPASDNEDKGIPRYPDDICEPDEGYRRKKPTKLSDIPIIETEDIESHGEDETDECLLSVNEKVNIFVQEADKLTTQERSNTKLNVARDIPKRPKSPKCEKYPEEDETYTSVSEKVSHFIETAERIQSQQKPTYVAPKVSRPIFTDLDESIKTDDCLLSVSDKVNKFTRTSERQETENTKPVSLAKLNQSPLQPRRTTTECVRIDTEEDAYIKTPKQREVSPTIVRKNSIELDSTPKTSRKIEPKNILSTTGRMRSTESIRKAKEIFESISKDETVTKKPHRERTPTNDKCELKSTRLVMDKIYHRQSPNKDDLPGYMRPLNRSPRPHSPYVERSQSQDRSRSPSVEIRQKSHSPSLENIPHYMWPLDRTTHEHVHEDFPKRDESPDYQQKAQIKSTHDVNDKTSPHYMWPLDRAPHEHDHEHPHHEGKEHSPKREESPSYQPKGSNKYRTQDTYNDKTSQFGVVHKTESKKVTTQRRKLTTVEIENILTTHEIEEIYDIEVLDILLERAVNYEQRRRIRAQIRIVKQLTIDNKLPSVLIKEYSATEKVREPSVEKYKTCKEEQTLYSHSKRRHSSDVKVSTNEVREIRKSPDRKPDNKKVLETKTVFKTELKRVEPVRKKVEEEKPSWVTQRSLKKPSEVISKNKPISSIVKKQTDSRRSPTKDRKPTDDITSSYGVGPTDENGAPLFGLKALRARTTTGTTKVQGTVIKSHYYSENGQEPVGEISVTKYSSDPNDFEGDLVDEEKGLLSVTTTKKFGTKSTPTKAIRDRENYCKDTQDERHENITQSTKITRRGSVKQMSQKFIENAVETSKNERQSSYPKAGLILRTSSFKKSSSREQSPEDEVRTTSVRRTITSSSGESSDTFLNNQKRVSNVQEVITRMKNSEYEVQEGDTVEDAEARKLLNKFIGSQVILSGMESHSSASPSIETTVKRTTTTTTTSSKGGGKPTVVTRTFTHPITQDDLDSIWDEQTLKLLLERSTDYEERRLIRRRLRDIMAEKEVCADVTTKTTEESSGRVEETIETNERAGPVTTTQVTRITSQQVSKKPLSPFAKFRQLDKQNSLNTPPGTPRTPTGSAPLFKFTDPELSRQASTVKERLLQWCQMKTKEYENVQLDNFSSSWADGLAFCALIHHFMPDAFDYHALKPENRKHNFTLAFQIADEKANIVPLLDVEDMIATRKPDWKCVFTYVQTIYARFKKED